MLLVFILKVCFVCVLLIIIRGTLPRYRLDMAANKVWKEWLFSWLFLLVFNSLLFFVLF